MACSCGCLECTCHGRCVCPHEYCLCTSCYKIRQNQCSSCGRPSLSRTMQLRKTSRIESCKCLSGSETMSAASNVEQRSDVGERSSRQSTLGGEHELLPTISTNLSNIPTQDANPRIISDLPTVANISDFQSVRNDQSEKETLPIIPLYETELITEQIDSQDESSDDKATDPKRMKFDDDYSTSQCMQTDSSPKLPSDRISPDDSSSSHDPDSLHNFSEYTSKSLISSDDDPEKHRNLTRPKYPAETKNPNVKYREKADLSLMKSALDTPPIYYSPSTGLSTPMPEDLVPPSVSNVSAPFYYKNIPNIPTAENPTSDTRAPDCRGAPASVSRMSPPSPDNSENRVCSPPPSKKGHFGDESNIMIWLHDVGVGDPHLNLSRPGSAQGQSNNDSDSKEMDIDAGIGSATGESLSDVKISPGAGPVKPKSRMMRVPDSSTSSSSNDIRRSRALCKEVNKIIDDLGSSLKDIGVKSKKSTTESKDSATNVESKDSTTESKDSATNVESKDSTTESKDSATNVESKDSTTESKDSATNVESKDSTTDEKPNGSELPEKSSDSENVLSENYAADLSSDAPSSQD